MYMLWNAEDIFSYGNSETNQIRYLAVFLIINCIYVGKCINTVIL